MQLFNAVRVVHQLLLAKLATARTIVDATAGNGRDTLFLAANSGPEAVVTAFDIQQTALLKTRQLLAGHNLTQKVVLVLDDHANITRHIASPVDVAVFNLGYLPGGSHDITTTYASTAAAIEQLTKLLNVGGIISLVAYPGYPAGNAEHILLKQYLRELAPEYYTVSCWQIMNHTGNSPVLYLIEKVRRVETSEGCTSRQY